jgi:hypothetical protein
LCDGNKHSSAVAELLGIWFALYLGNKIRSIHMGVTKFTFYIGIVFILVGVAGFIPGFVHSAHLTDPDLVVESGYGRIFGLFPVNILHNLVHVGLGIWALLVAKDVAKAIYFCRFSAILYGVLAVMGLIPGLNTMFGLVPVFGHDVWLHVILAAATGYFGFVPVRDHHEVHA